MEKIAALEDAIEKNSLVGIYSVFYTIAHGDPNFSTHKFRDVLEYVKSKNIEKLMQKFDGEEFEPEDKWDEDYWALVASSLMDNFCDERIDHLEAVGKKVYPVKAAGIPKAAGTIEPDRRPQPAFNTNTQPNSNNRLITEEEKRVLKSTHAKKLHKKDDGGFFAKIFRSGSRR
jgi:hypothetical protein